MYKMQKKRYVEEHMLDEMMNIRGAMKKNYYLLQLTTRVKSNNESLYYLCNYFS